MKKILLGVALCLSLAACDSFTAQRYSISADNDMTLKAMAGTHVTVGTFTTAKEFDHSCRLVGPIELPDGLTYEGYVQKAFKDELQVAGLYDTQAPVSLTGVLTNVSSGSTSGTWEISITVNSSNGKSLSADEHYDFHTSFSAVSACHNVADAFQPAVQSLIGKVIASPDFKALLKQ